MALNLNNKYPGRSNPPSIDYPEGSIKNQTAPGAKDGTPLDADWANDKEGFFQKLLQYRGLSANGEVDNVNASQYFDALFSDPTESLRGLPLKASAADVMAFLDDSKMLTPAMLAAALSITPGKTWDANDSIILPGGLILKYGNRSMSAATLTLTYEVAFPNATLLMFPYDVHPQSGSSINIWTDSTTWTRTGGVVYGGPAAGIMWFALGW